MNLSSLDWIIFGAFIVFNIGVSLYAGRKEETSEDYFLAGRGLNWWVIGFSLIATNISTEQFVGMAGASFGKTGLAIASYEWYAAVVLVIIALYLLPFYLKLGIFTMPEFLKVRYGETPRTILAIFMMVAYIGVGLAGVLYSGAIGLNTIFHMDLNKAIWIIGVSTGLYTIYGGLSAVAWTDFLQGIGLLLGGAMVTVIGVEKMGGLSTFLANNPEKLHMILPATDPDIPWTALCFGMIIPHFFYWGFNQFITQKTLAAKSLKQGQKGIVLAAAIKLFLPFIVVFPGIIAFQLYRDQITNPDQSYAVLVKNILPAGLRGLFFAALAGAVMSTLSSMLNSAATIFTLDIYKRFFDKNLSGENLVKVGRLATAAFALAGCLIAPFPGRFDGVFRYMQMIWGFISPGIVVVFIFGLIFRRAPAIAASTTMILGIPVYGLLLRFIPNAAFLNQMGITFIILTIVMAVISVLNPLPEPVHFQSSNVVELTPSRSAKWIGILVVLATICLYVRFW